MLINHLYHLGALTSKLQHNIFEYDRVVNLASDRKLHELMIQIIEDEKHKKSIHLVCTQFFSLVRRGDMFLPALLMHINPALGTVVDMGLSFFPANRTVHLLASWFIIPFMAAT